jgi:hypothetical protein
MADQQVSFNAPSEFVALAGALVTFIQSLKAGQSFVSAGANALPQLESALVNVGSMGADFKAEPGNVAMLAGYMGGQIVSALLLSSGSSVPVGG